MILEKRVFEFHEKIEVGIAKSLIGYSVYEHSKINSKDDWYLTKKKAYKKYAKLCDQWDELINTVYCKEYLKYDRTGDKKC